MINKDWNSNQLNAFYFSTLILLLKLVNENEKIKKIFELGGLSFVPSNSQINNWRKTKKGSSIFHDEYLNCFVTGLAKLNNITNIDGYLCYPKKVSFFYNFLAQLFKEKTLENANINDLEVLIDKLHKKNM